jgi:hypothetical protein
MASAHLKRANAFWVEMSACEHFVQIYECEEVFLDVLTSFVSEALKEGHAVVVIATPAHRQELNERLIDSGHDLQRLSGYRTGSSLWMRKKRLESSWLTDRSTMSFSFNSWLTFWRVRPKMAEKYGHSGRW